VFYTLTSAITIIFLLPVSHEQILAGCFIEALHLLVRLDGDTPRGTIISHERIVKTYSFVYHQLIWYAVHRVKLVDGKVSSILTTVLL
jgi:hypothetical protein